MWLDKMSDNEHQADKHDKSALNALDAYDTTPVTKPFVNEVIPVGKFNPAPEHDEPVYNEVNANNTVGPFNVSAKQFRDFKSSHSSAKLDELVEAHALRPSTALCIKSGQFDHVVNLLESGQKPTAEMVQRFLPGDLQRVIEAERRGGK